MRIAAALLFVGAVGCESAPATSPAPRSVETAPARQSASARSPAAPSSSSEAASSSGAAQDDCDRLFEHWVNVLFADYQDKWTEEDKERMREQVKSDGSSIAAQCRRDGFSRAEFDCMFKAQTSLDIIRCQE
jgi:hypothetical protein